MFDWLLTANTVYLCCDLWYNENKWAICTNIGVLMIIVVIIRWLYIVILISLHWDHINLASFIKSCSFGIVLMLYLIYGLFFFGLSHVRFIFEIFGWIIFILSLCLVYYYCYVWLIIDEYDENEWAICNDWTWSIYYQ